MIEAAIPEGFTLAPTLVVADLMNLSSGVPMLISADILTPRVFCFLPFSHSLGLAYQGSL